MNPDMNIGCIGQWEIEAEGLAKKDSLFVCTDRDDCFRYSLRNVEMIGKFDVVPLSLIKEGIVQKCPEFISTPFQNLEGFRKGSSGLIPPGVI